MDRRWMYLEDRFCKEYIDGVKSFIEKATKSRSYKGEARCPCRDCKNVCLYNLETIERHLYQYGFASNYKRWIYHGEEFEHSKQKSRDNQHVMFDESNSDDEDTSVSNDVHGPTSSNNIHYDSVVGGNKAEGDGSATEAMDFISLLQKANSPLYPGCTKMLGLDFLAKLMHLKVLNHWSDKSLDMLLELLKNALPEGANLPASYHEAKKLLQDLGLGYQLIHACKYDCTLFWKEHASCDKCPICDEPRYKYENGNGRKIPQKVLYYFPLKPRLQRLFMSKQIAMDMRWHKEKRVDVEGVYKHPADSKEWKNFHKEYPWFAEDARNVRLGLATKGFNPFGNTSKTYNIWPVTLVPYNFPPMKCMDEAFFFLTLIIPGPESPGRDIDVYMRPLIDELKDLWSNGVQTHDAFSGETFQLHACLLWTINDFSTYESLSGWSMMGSSACPICQMDTSALPLRNKLCYLGHRRYLPPDHSWRDHRQYKASWGAEHDLAYERTSKRDDIFLELDSVPILKTGKNPNNKNRKRRRELVGSNWIKRSVFFELEYWCNLAVRHNLDVMYTEKNLCDNIIGTLLNIEGKTKDTNYDRLDLADLNIRKELHFELRHNVLWKPVAWYTIPSTYTHDFCSFLKYVKLPDAYPIDISKKISLINGKISELEAYECHVILQRLLPLAVYHSCMHNDLVTTMTELSHFFQQLCAKTLRAKDLDKLQERIALILCKFEKIYPPSFFDVMVHSAVHLPEEAKLVGPVGFRWMYPFERYLEKLRQYVRKRGQPEDSIAEAYSAHEALRFCSIFVHNTDTHLDQDEQNCNVGHGKPKASLSFFTQRVQPFGKQECERYPSQELQTAHSEVLFHSNDIEAYAKEHLDELKTISSVDVQRRHLDEFSSWFEKRIKDLRQTDPTKVTDELYSLASGPDSKVNRYHGCMVDGVKFLIQEKDEHKVTRNSVVCSLDLHGDVPLDFYGILCSVLELNYKSGYRAILFKCKPFADRKLDGRKSCFTTANIQLRDLNYGDHHVFVLADQAVHAFDLDVKYGRVNIQRLQHRLFWDALETTTDEEVEDATVNRTLDTCNFEWSEHVSDIRTRGFVHTSLEPEVINAGVVPNLSGEAVHDQSEMFDDPWIDKPTFYMSSSSSEEKYLSSDADSN